MAECGMPTPSNKPPRTRDTIYGILLVFSIPILMFIFGIVIYIATRC